MSTEQRMAIMTTLALWSTDETAAYLNIPPRTLDQWAYQGYGPRWSKVGRYRRYRRGDVDAWLESQSRGGDLAS